MENIIKRETCTYCEYGEPLAIGKTNDQGITIHYPNKLVAYGYNISGYNSNGIAVNINYCPICGRNLQIKRTDRLFVDVYDRGLRIGSAFINFDIINKPMISCHEVSIVDHIFNIAYISDLGYGVVINEEIANKMKGGIRNE